MRSVLGRRTAWRPPARRCPARRDRPGLDRACPRQRRREEGSVR